MAPWNGSRGGQRWRFAVAPPWLPHARLTASVGCISVAKELAFYPLSLSKAHLTMYVVAWWLEHWDHEKLVGSIDERERERERGGLKERERLGEEERDEWQEDWARDDDLLEILLANMARQCSVRGLGMTDERERGVSTLLSWLGHACPVNLFFFIYFENRVVKSQFYPSFIGVKSPKCPYVKMGFYRKRLGWSSSPKSSPSLPLKLTFAALYHRQPLSTIVPLSEKVSNSILGVPRLIWSFK